MSCGKELADDAEVPLKWQALMDHVATNMEAHAAWVGANTDEARAEQDGLVAVANAYRAMADAAGRAAAAMTAMRDLAPAPHDPTRLDRAALGRWMTAKVAMQRDFAALLERHAAASDAALVKADKVIETETPK